MFCCFIISGKLVFTCSAAACMVTFIMRSRFKTAKRFCTSSRLAGSVDEAPVCATACAEKNGSDNRSADWPRTPARQNKLSRHFDKNCFISKLLLIGNLMHDDFSGQKVDTQQVSPAHHGRSFGQN